MTKAPAAPQANDMADWLVQYLSTVPRPPLVNSPKLRSKFQHLSFEDLLTVIERAALPRLDVIELYKLWIEVNTGKSPLLFGAWFNVGVELAAAGDKHNAVTAYKNAMALKADFYQAAINYGLMLEADGNSADALALWEQALQGAEARTMLLNQRGRLLENIGRLEESEYVLRASLMTTPAQPDVIHHWLHLRQKLCKWPTLGADIQGLTENDIIAQAGPLAALAQFDDVGVLRQVISNWVERKIPPAPARLSPPEGYRHDKIRVGYMSSDFCMHAMSYLVAELLERHDRSRFEVYGYCSTKEDGSALRKRVIAAFDHFVPVGHLPEEELAQRIRSDEIDILVDLNGLTLGAKMHTLRWKPAPVQITYLGFVGPIPLPELDYILCDRFVIPEDIADRYWPKPLYLPGVFQANDTKITGLPAVTRSEFGLPDDKFIFCCFSHHYKIKEEVFAAWMDILRRAPNAILWLTADNEWSCRNLAAHAAAAGVSADRLVFADRVDQPRYLARMGLADLFLDTFPYNAGTIASDALRVGVPIVTLLGQSFSSRMAGSLLNSMGLTEGIATSLPDYVAKAAAFANDGALHAAYRGRLGGDRWRQTIGNIERFVAQLEDVFQSTLKR